MPTYEYRCATCGDFEAVHGMKDPSLTACPTCGAPVTRLISKGGGLIFKGTGFYSTDYRSADYKEKAAGESGAAKPAPTGDAKAPASPESKPAGGSGAGATPAAGSTGGTGTSPASGSSTPSSPPPSTGGSAAS